MAEKARRFRGLFVGSSVIPIFSGFARRLEMEGADLRRLNAGTHPVLVDHAATFGGQVGRVLNAKVTDDGVEGEIEIFADAPEEVHRAISNGMRNLSIGFKPLKNRQVETDMGMVVVSEQWEADEVSLVAVGASRVARLMEEVDGKAD